MSTALAHENRPASPIIFRTASRGKRICASPAAAAEERVATVVAELQTPEECDLFIECARKRKSALLANQQQLPVVQEAVEEEESVPPTPPPPAESPTPPNSPTKQSTDVDEEAMMAEARAKMFEDALEFQQWVVHGHDVDSFVPLSERVKE